MTDGTRVRRDATRRKSRTRSARASCNQESVKGGERGALLREKVKAVDRIYVCSRVRIMCVLVRHFLVRYILLFLSPNVFVSSCLWEPRGNKSRQSVDRAGINQRSSGRRAQSRSTRLPIYIYILHAVTESTKVYVNCFVSWKRVSAE